MHLVKLLKQRLLKACKLSFCISLFALSSLSFNTPLTAGLHHQDLSEDALELGIELETEFWTLVQKQNIRKFSRKLAEIFQGLNVSGVYNRDQQISGLTGATLFSFVIGNPIATRRGDTLVFSYDFIAIGSDLTSGPSVTVWKKSGHSWKIISHSYVPFTN